jgi:hypothetical protein
MYLHLGEKTAVRSDSIIGIFDLDNTTVSKNTREFLKQAEQHGQVVNVSYELPKSFVVCSEKGKNKVFISQISSQTLLRRLQNYENTIKRLR